MRVEQLVSLKDALWAERSTTREVWELSERFALPFTGEFYRENKTEASIDWLLARRIYDTTAVMGTQLLAADIHANMSSDAIKWKQFKFRSQESNDNSEKRRWLSECDDIASQTISDSNFGLEVSEMYLGLIAYGPAVLTQEAVNEDPKNWKGVTYRGVQVKEAYWTESAIDGRPGIFIRVIMMTAAQMVDKWGRDVPKEIKDQSLTTDGQIIKQEVLFCVYPRDIDVDTSKVINPLHRPFGFKYVVKNLNLAIGKEGGYYSMPAYIPRWRRHIDSKFGYSPTILAMGSILNAQKTIEMELAAGAKAIDPSILTSEGNVWGDLDTGAGTINVVTDVNGIRTLESGMRLDVSQYLLEREQEQIRNFYYTNYIQLKESPQMTAYETSQRVRQSQKFLGPTYGRLVNDLYDPMLKDLFWMLYRANQFPPMPKSVKNDRDEFDIEYTGPLALAQKGQTSDAIKMYMQGMVAMSDRFPKVLDIPNIDAVAKRIAELDGVPIDIINTDADIKKVRNAKQQQMDTANKIAMAQAGGDAAQSVATAQQMGADVG